MPAGCLPGQVACGAAYPVPGQEAIPSGLARRSACLAHLGGIKPGLDPKDFEVLASKEVSDYEPPERTSRFEFEQHARTTGSNPPVTYRKNVNANWRKEKEHEQDI